VSSEAASVRGRRSRSVRTRERIVAAATHVFARRGLHGARVADIAEEAGIAYGLVYHHFRNKEEILAAIFQERWGRHLGYLEEVAASPAPVRERLARLVHFWVETYRNEPHLMTVMINEISRSYEFIESHDVGTVMEAFAIVEGMLARARDGGELRADLDCRLASYLVLGAAEMVLTGYVLGTLGRTTREQYAADERQLVAMLVDGICTGAA
jgi:AcrR family transcriptional regulator